ncbi:MAG TPA: hypothetical protein QF641_02320 [Candidatus Thalassarchaeaceae archaeon]|nr:hypothetical protein [Candidatus Thalassarchaeaceae archaeon]
MVSGKRAWAIRSTGTSFILLILAIIAIMQLYPSIAFDEEEYVVRIGHGEQADFEVDEDTILTALRVNEGSHPSSELRLENGSGSEFPGRAVSWIEGDRPGLDGEKIYSLVRIFEGLEPGSYTLFNDAESSELWLVDDGNMMDEMYSNPWMWLFWFGCCLGIPVGLVGIVLAIMTWADRRKSPDQFVVFNDGSVILTDTEDYSPIEGDVNGVRGPFVGVPEIGDDTVPVVEESRWMEWDDG